MTKLYLLIVLLALAHVADAQGDTPISPQIPLMRQKFHEDIDKQQKEILKLDGKDDGQFTPAANNNELNMQATYAVINKTDALQNMIEQDSLLDGNNKIKYLRGLNDVLYGFLNDVRYKKIKPIAFTDVLSAYEDAMQLEREEKSIIPVVAANSLETGEILLRSYAFQQNAGMADAKELLILKDCQKNPSKILPILNNHPNSPYADSLIILASRRSQEELYNFAASTGKLGVRIQKSEDPLVKIIARMARIKTGRQYFPFLDDLYKGKRTFEEIDAVMNDSVKYYKLLVQTEIAYADRLIKRDTPLVMNTLTARLQQKARDVFINEINGLHELPDAVRFKKIEVLTPEELYYLAVLGEEEIYTSSYTHGVYPFIFKKMRVPRGDSLLLSVRFDHFKKWIKMAANYNTLDHFLKTMEKENAEMLMKAFVKGLDRTNSLEDAVDVANSYASITDKNIQNLILDQIQYNLAESKRIKNVRGERVYSILNTLFLSMDSVNHIDVSTTLGIPPVYFMPNSLLRDTAGRIIVQQFFYGDKDGQTVFNAFVRGFSNGNWKITSTNQWVAVSSVKGVPVTIYANKPLDEEKGLDAEAQAALSKFLDEKDLHPSVVIHRGHSYYLNSTIAQLAPSAKIILLGSCGGYQSLSRVLGICPYAQIISSKQTGSGLINAPMITALMETARQGKDLNWPGLWGNLSKMFANNEMFADYVPPYKNLGAVFIMAYTKMEEND
ncbi:hypothetical protein SAMN05421788_101690 [Filimonas lacunae]|uniref:CHAT domain-containing protein n=2 Tax=Filimonas lacunae TaxID=477680 RepID=A0A173MP84_9BACT|nr:hypothetical protein FLA_5298 [Filimonas lacunae]SIS69786.1 hypothetical protein SAMN05421788_101690 [Filimonas lacunae]